MFSSSHKGHGSGSLQALRSRCLGATTSFIPCWVFWCCVAALVHAAWVAMLLRREGIPTARLRPAEMRRRREAHETLRARIDSSTVWTLIFSVQVLTCVRTYFQISLWKGPNIHEGCSGTRTRGICCSNKFWWGHSRIIYEYSRDILTYILGFWFDCMDFPWLLNTKSKWPVCGGTFLGLEGVTS